MNVILRRLMPLLLLSAMGENSIIAMQREIVLGKDMSNEQLIAGIKELPNEVTRYIIYLLIGSFFNFDFSPFKVIDLEWDNDVATAVALSADGKTYCIATKTGFAYVWDLKTDEIKTPFMLHSGAITSVAFSPNGENCLTGSKDGSVYVWDATTGKEVAKYRVERAESNPVAFCPNGERCLSGAGDMTARV